MAELQISSGEFNMHPKCSLLQRLGEQIQDTTKSVARKYPVLFVGIAVGHATLAGFIGSLFQLPLAILWGVPISTVSLTLIAHSLEQRIPKKALPVVPRRSDVKGLIIMGIINFCISLYFQIGASQTAVQTSTHKGVVLLLASFIQGTQGAVMSCEDSTPGLLENYLNKAHVVSLLAPNVFACLCTLTCIALMRAYRGASSPSASGTRVLIYHLAGLPLTFRMLSCLSEVLYPFITISMLKGVLPVLSFEQLTNLPLKAIFSEVLLQRCVVVTLMVFTVTRWMCMTVKLARPLQESYWEHASLHKVSHINALEAK